MKIMAFNGSPRRNGNTAKLLKEALRGAAASGADTEIRRPLFLELQRLYQLFLL